jgi:hypothetical protein
MFVVSKQIPLLTKVYAGISTPEVISIESVLITFIGTAGTTKAIIVYTYSRTIAEEAF